MSNTDDVCSVCLCEVTNDKYLLEPCKHVFHASCLIDCLRKCGPNCPNCRGVDPVYSNNNVSFIGESHFENFFTYRPYDNGDNLTDDNETDDNEINNDTLIQVSRFGEPFETVLSRGDIISPNISTEEGERLFITEPEISGITITEEDVSLNHHIIDLSFNLDDSLIGIVPEPCV